MGDGKGNINNVVDISSNDSKDKTKSKEVIKSIIIPILSPFITIILNS